MAGTGSGKLGSQVYAAVSGEQIVRNYQPKVSNPNTTKQVNQRARMKLMSQLSAAMASAIVIPKEGMKSSRNLFVKKNFAQTIAVEGHALCFLENLQLTAGNAALPHVAMSRDGEGALSIFLMDDARAQADRIVYNLYARSEEGDLMLINSVVCETPGEDGDFPVEVEDYSADLFVYAYGMKDLNAKAKAKYGNYKVETGEDIAKLMMTRTLSMSDYQVTETQGNSMTVDDESSALVPEGSVAIRFQMLGDGAIRLNTASGSVQVSPVIVRRGTQKKFLAVAAPGYRFNKWIFVENDEGTGVEYTNNPITFTAWGNINMIVCFDPIA